MQIKNNHSNYLQNSWLIGAFKVVITVGCFYFLISKLQNQSISFDSFPIPNGLGLYLSVVIVLMLLNWYLEALRWRISVGLFEEMTMKDAWRAILSGLALNWVLPFTSGDLLARISQQKDKYQATSAAMLNRGIMLVITLFLGIGGISFIARQYDFNGWFLTGIIFGVPLLKWLFKRSIERFLIYFREISRSLLLKIILLSVVRYAVFVMQFYLLLRLFLPSLDTELLIAGIGWVFLVRTSLPLFFGGIGVREASGVFFFSPHVEDIQLVIIPIFLIWIINTVLPSLVGIIFIWGLRSNSENS